MERTSHRHTGYYQLRFDAFLSYSHRSDARFGAELHRALESFGSPYFTRRDLRIFLDDANAPMSDDLWNSVIRPALHSSRFLLLLASPGSASSEWVAREFDEFLSLMPPTAENIPVGIVLSSGKTPWTDQDFDPSDKETAALFHFNH